MIIFKLDDLLWRNKKTAEEVKLKTGISAATLSNIKNGKNINISIKTIDKLCKYFDCPVSDLLEYIPESKN